VRRFLGHITLFARVLAFSWVSAHAQYVYPGDYGGWGGWGGGTSARGFGSALHGMGYMPYMNPYYDYGATAGMAMPYDYSQPIDTVSATAAESVTDPAMALFDAGRASFKEGNYADALQKTNDALAKLPNDTTLHEFRSLCLFETPR
jgi:hypothetical protein